LRLLWVENHDRFIAVTLQRFLHAHSVSVVPSLLQARQRLVEEVFDAVLLDYDLDDGKGSELVSHIRSLPNRPLLVAVSSHAEGNARLLAAGADRVCSKSDFAQIGTVLATDPNRCLSDNS
jgi:CheY-like chemotaxis protein